MSLGARRGGDPAGWLLDTNVVSELRKPRCHPAVRAWVRARPPEALFLSEVTMAEIRFGIGRLPPGDPLRPRLEAWIDSDLRPWFAGRVLPVNEDALVEWRWMVERGRAERHTFAQPDLFLAAIAALRGLCVVTRNVADFARAGVPVLDPWAAPVGPEG